MGHEADNEMEACIKQTSLLDPHVLYTNCLEEMVQW
jgi:hypothetical protein